MDNKAQDFEKSFEEYKNKKKEELEELVEDIAKGLQGVLLCKIIYLAKSLRKQGYKKIAEDCVVLTSRELADSMGESCRQSNKVVVRKVLDEIKFLIEERNGADIEDLSIDGTILEEVLDEVAKDYGLQGELK